MTILIGRVSHDAALTFRATTWLLRLSSELGHVYVTPEGAREMGIRLDLGTERDAAQLAALGFIAPPAEFGRNRPVGPR
jgi:hypothetical protein